MIILIEVCISLEQSWLFINYIILLWSKCKTTQDTSEVLLSYCPQAKVMRRAPGHRQATISLRTSCVEITLRPDIASTMISVSSHMVSKSLDSTRKATISIKLRNVCHSPIKLVAPTVRGATSYTCIPMRKGPGNGQKWTTDRCFGMLNLARHPLVFLTDNIISLDLCCNQNVPVLSKNIIITSLSSSALQLVESRVSSLHKILK